MSAPYTQPTLNSIELAEHQKALDMIRTAGSSFAAGMHSVPTWLGGKWILRRDGKIIPLTGNVPDYMKERTHNATYEGPEVMAEFGRPVVSHYDYYRHRPLMETVGAVCPTETIEAIIATEMGRIFDTHNGRRPDEAIEQLQKAREARIRELNPPGEAWDKDERRLINERRTDAEVAKEAEVAMQASQHAKARADAAAKQAEAIAEVANRAQRDLEERQAKRRGKKAVP